MSTQQGLIPGRRFGTFKLSDALDFTASHGSGATLFATDGREYIDLVIGSGPLILGHAHPRVVEAVQRQITRGTTFYVMNEEASRLAERIVQDLPSAEAIKFVGAGTEATFYALRIARAATQRSLVLKFEGGFHGHHDYALQSMAPRSGSNYPSPEPDSAGIPAAVSESVLIAPFNDLAAATEVAMRHAADLAAIIVEPVQRTLMPEPGFLTGLRALADRTGALLIFDEVVTGYRIAPGSAEQAFGVTPDLTALGKIIGGGLPLAAVTGRRALLDLTVSDQADNGHYVYMSGTFNGNALSAVAGLATLEVLAEEALLPRLETIGQTLARRFTASAVKLGIPFQMIGPPCVCEPVFDERPIRDYRSYAGVDRSAAQEFGYEMLRRGIFVRPGSKYYLPAVLTDAQVDRICEAAEAAMTAVRDHGLFRA